tara:strand:- start:132 stop:395 length:264 start_codon:yes stop_codon:yes gene_type:complete
MEIFNRTDLPLDTLAEVGNWQSTNKLLKVVKSEWRQREIKLYEHPTDQDKIISMGEKWDQTELIIVEETRQDWFRELASPKLNVTTH